MPDFTAPGGHMKLARLLKAVFAQQMREADPVRMIVTGRVPSLAHWTGPMADAVRPLVLRWYQQGYLAMRSTAAPETRRGSPFVKAAVPYSTDFGLFNQDILTAVDRMTFDFCQATNDTATGTLEEVITELRAQMKEGLARSEAVLTLAKRVRKLFADPFRAHRIAVTESSRAIHGGELISAKKEGVVKRMRWQASSDACRQCLAIDGREVAPGDPFHVNPKGGPYAFTYHPPLHPFCMCTQTPVLG